MKHSKLDGKPLSLGTKPGQTVQTSKFSDRNGSSALGVAQKDTFWKWNGKSWNEIEKTEFMDSKGGSTSFSQLSEPTLGNTTGAKRYPRDIAQAPNADYVMFEMYQYQPPFQNINKGDTKDNSTGLAGYNESATRADFYKKTSEKPVILYMPEDISTGYKANWSGKSFSNIGRDALSTVGSGDGGQVLQNTLNTMGDAFSQLIPNTGNKIVREVISKITGEGVSQNDVFGTTRGVILNPNVELLFSGTDLRNFQLNYKLIPRNSNEAEDIKEILKIFKRSMLPRFSDGTELNFSRGKNAANNFIKVPNVCKVSFMRGGGLNRDVPQYKMCAVTQVDVNFTPDGTYATYDDGTMVAYQLGLNFQETKLIFAEEVDNY
jgi:hypothetical protein